MSWLRRLAREPLVVFLVIGAGVFLLDHGMDRDARTGPEPVVLDRAFVDGLAAGGGSREERVAAWIRDEVLVREARARSLDRGDPIVRQRLVQKMELLLESTAEIEAPTQAELETRLREDPRYRRPAQTVFEHVFFGRERADPVSDARAALAAGPRGHGDAFLLGASIGPRTDVSLRSTFGEGFTEGLRRAPVGRWSEPLRSAYGVHLVRVERREPSTVPELDEVEGRVRADLERERRAAEVRRMIEARIEATPVVRR